MKNATNKTRRKLSWSWLPWYLGIVATVAAVQAQGITRGAPSFESAFVGNLQKNWPGVLGLSALLQWIGAVLPYHSVKQRGWDERDRQTYKEQVRMYRQGYRAGWEDRASGKESQAAEWSPEEDDE